MRDFALSSFIASALAVTLLLGMTDRVYGLGLERIGQITPSGTDGLLSPSSFCYDSVRGYFIVSNTTQRQIAVLTREGRVVKVFGKKNEIGFPVAVAIDSRGTLYFSEKNSESIRVVTRYDAVVGQEYTAIDLSMHRLSAPVQPTVIFVDEENRLFLVDRGNRQILVLNSDATLLFSIRDVGDPADLWVEQAGNILVADPGLGGIRVYSPVGRLLRIVGANPEQFREPLRAAGLAVDPKGRIWTVDAARGGVIALDSLGNRVFSGATDLFSPVDLAIDLQNNLYVLEQGANRITVFRISEF